MNSISRTLAPVEHSKSRRSAPRTDFWSNIDMLGWTQAKVARKLGVTPSTVTAWHKFGVPVYAENFAEQALAIKWLWDELNE